MIEALTEYSSATWCHSGNVVPCREDSLSHGLIKLHPRLPVILLDNRFLCRAVVGWRGVGPAGVKFGGGGRRKKSMMQSEATGYGVK